MSQATVRIPAPLRSLTGGAAEVQVEGQTVGEVLRSLATNHEGIGERLLDADGNLRSFVNVFVGDQNVRSLEGLDSTIDHGALIHIIPAVAGGRP